MVLSPFQTFFAIVLLAVAAAADTAPYRPAPYQPAPAYKQAASYEEPAAYNFNYAVQDDYAQLNYGQNEERNGYATTGSYNVALPDGRIQTVTYTVADAYSGYVADVTYSGEAQYAAAPAAYKPVYKPAPYQPAPKYAPKYAPAPAYSA